MLELFLAISASLEAIFLLFMLSVSATQSLSVSIVFLHSVVCDFWVGCRVEIFGFRSTLLSNIARHLLHQWVHRRLSLPSTVVASSSAAHVSERDTHAQGSLSPFPARGDHASPSHLPLPRFSVAPSGTCDPCWREAF
jgi:hypothetical protein